MQYVVTFALASYFFVLAGRAENKYLIIRIGRAYRIHIPTVYAAIGVIVLSILAGLRGPNIGADVRTYVLPSWNRILEFSSVKEVIDKHYMEIGYELLEYLVSRFTSDVHWLHFVTALIGVGGYAGSQSHLMEKILLQ